MTIAQPRPFSFTASDAVSATVTDGVLRVRIEREEKRNPLSLGVLDAIRIAFEAHAEQADIRLATITGSGAQAFASGGDLKELDAYRAAEQARAFSQHGKAALNAIRQFPVPVVARLNGVALGGGAELAVASDLRYAAPHARIGFIHARLKIAPSWGGGHDLIRLVGPARALRMMAEARILDASEAAQLGLVDLVAPQDEDFDPWFEARIAALTTNPPQVMRAIKGASRRMAGRAEADELETEHFATVWAHEDHWTAVAALERRR